MNLLFIGEQKQRALSETYPLTTDQFLLFIVIFFQSSLLDNFFRCSHMQHQYRSVIKQRTRSESSRVGTTRIIQQNQFMFVQTKKTSHNSSCVSFVLSSAPTRPYRFLFVRQNIRLLSFWFVDGSKAKVVVHRFIRSATAEQVKSLLNGLNDRRELPRCALLFASYSLRRFCFVSQPKFD